MTHLVIINLKRRPDRWESLSQHIKEHKSQLGFIDSIHRIEAVECDPPSKGCMLSHAKAIQLAKDQFWDSVMVVEDDVRFQENVDKVWASIQTELESVQWKVLFGGSVSIRPRDLSSFSPHLLKVVPPDGILTGTHCMVYHSRSYDELIQLITEEVKSPYPYHIDLLISSKCSPLFLAVPYLAMFKESDKSDVRVGRDTKVDYQNITNAQKIAKMIAGK